MKSRILLAGFCSVLLTACAAVTPIPTVPPTAARILTPTPIPTATPVKVDLLVKDKLVNCRSGPGTIYESVNELTEGQSAHVVGRNESSTWWYIRDPGNPNGFCWVSADVTEVQGAVEELPVVQPPITRVTKVSLRADPNLLTVSCDQFPQTVFFEAEVTTDGPAYVTWRWEASTGVSSEKTIRVFDEAGKQVINDYYQIGAPNEYWVKLHIFEPNEVIQQVNFTINCTPIR